MNVNAVIPPDPEVIPVRSQPRVEPKRVDFFGRMPTGGTRYSASEHALRREVP